MKNFTKYLIILALFLTANICFAAQKDIVSTKLKNGQTVVVKQVTTNPSVVIDTWIKTGSINETDKNSGVAHFLEHLFFKGTKNNPTGTFDRILESKGAETNAATSKDYTHYYITIPAKDFDLALELHSDMLLNPMIPRKELEKERLVVLEEISKNKDRAQNVMWENLFALIYGKNNPPHPYFRPVIGNSKVIETITREEILDFYNNFYSPSNMVTVIVGDIDPDSVIKKVEQAFLNNEVVKKETKTNYKVSPINSILRVEDKMDINQAYGAIAFSAPKFREDKDGYALDVLASILGGSKSSRLNQVLKEDKRLVYSISAGYSAMADDGIFEISFSCENKNLEEVEKEILNQIAILKKDGIKEAELNRAKNMIKTDTYYSRESISNIASELGYMTTFWGSTSYYENYLNNIEKVSANDVIHAAKKYLKKNAYAISTVRPKKDEIKEISNVNEKQGEKTLVAQTKDIKKYKLSNEMEFVSKKNEANSIIAIDIEAKGAKMLEKTPSTGIVAAQSAKGGTKSYSKQELNNLLDEKGIKLSLSSGQDVFSINLQVTENELDFALDILDEIVNRPLFSANEIQNVKELQKAAFKRVDDNAISIATDEFRRLAFSNSKYGQNSKFLLSSIDKVTTDEVKDYYNAILNPKNMTVSVAGNVDDDKLAQKFEEIFKPKKGEKITFKDKFEKTFVPSQNIISEKIKKDTQTSWVILGYKTVPLYNEKELATLKVINAIMGEGMSSRLFTNLRDEKGLAYVVGSSISQNIYDGAWFSYIGTNEKNIKTAKEGILDEVSRLKKEYVSKTELKEAKDKIFGNLVISLETNMDDASTNGWYAATERPIDQLEIFKKSVEAVSQADILEFANKYFSKPYICVVVKPN